MNNELIKKLNHIFDSNKKDDENHSQSYYLIESENSDIIFQSTESHVKRNINEKFYPQKAKSYSKAIKLSKKDFLEKIKIFIDNENKKPLTVHLNNRSTLRSVITSSINSTDDELKSVLSCFRYKSIYEEPQDGYQEREINFESILKCNIDENKKQKAILLMFDSLVQTRHFPIEDIRNHREDHALKETLRFMISNNIRIPEKHINTLFYIKSELMKEDKKDDESTMNFYGDSKDVLAKNQKIWIDFVRNCVDKNIWNELIDSISNSNKPISYIKNQDNQISMGFINIEENKLFEKYPILSTERHLLELSVSHIDKYIEKIQVHGLTLIKQKDDSYDVVFKHNTEDKDINNIVKKIFEDHFELLNHTVTQNNNMKIKDAIESIDCLSMIKKNLLEERITDKAEEPIQIVKKRKI